ncbi:hypothetical protein LAM40_21140, partial [Mycobacterium tuberculosis]|nr:hypothetical protein [Mycobacterium tuberculosis]
AVAALAAGPAVAAYTHLTLATPVPGSTAVAAAAFADAVPSALAASRFSDREAFLAALLDDETAQRLTQLKQTLEQQLQQAAALCEQATRQPEAHLALRPQGVDADVPTLQTQLHALAQRLRDNTTRQGEIRQQLRQDAE